jgi:hypothetical protein
MYTTNQIYSRIGSCSRSGIEPEIEMEQTKPNVHGIDDQKAAAESYLDQGKENTGGTGANIQEGDWSRGVKRRTNRKHRRSVIQSTRKVTH